MEGLTWQTDIYRLYARRLHSRLIEEWCAPRRGRALKTDLFEESLGAEYGLLAWLGEATGFAIGIDNDAHVTRRAAENVCQARSAPCWAWVADVRRLPFRASMFELVVSTSTLDHFRNEEDIVASLREICRVLKPGGSLLLTMDNPENLIVFVRNFLPYRVLRAMGLIPYRMGKTYSRRRLLRTLAAVGFHVERTAFAMHAPRLGMILAQKLARILRSERMARRIVAMFARLEGLCFRSFASRTGYFVVVKASKAPVGSPTPA